MSDFETYPKLYEKAIMKKKLLLTFLSLFLCSQIRAGGFQVSLQGTKQLGLAHAGTALLFNDASTLFFNPGALSFTTGNHITGSLSPIFNRVSFLHQSTNIIHKKKSSIATPFAFYTSFQLQQASTEERPTFLSKLRFGLGVYTPFGSGVAYEDDWVGQYILREAALITVFFQPTVSYQINEKIGVGIGLVYGLGSFSLRRALPLADGSADGEIELEGSSTGIGFNAGLIFKPVERMVFGLSYRSTIGVKIDDGTVTPTVPAAVSSLFPSTTFAADITLPSVLTAGISFDLIENKTKLVGEVMLTGWNVYDELAFEFADPVGGDTALASARNYEDNAVLRFGVQQRISDAFTLRGGVYYDFSVAPDCCVTPETPDSDRRGFTLGASYQPSKNLSLDFGFQFLDDKERTSTNTEGNFTGTYDTRVYIPSVGVDWKF